MHVVGYSESRKLKKRIRIDRPSVNGHPTRENYGTWVFYARHRAVIQQLRAEVNKNSSHIMLAAVTCWLRKSSAQISRPPTDLSINRSTVTHGWTPIGSNPADSAYLPHWVGCVCWRWCLAFKAVVFVVTFARCRHDMDEYFPSDCCLVFFSLSNWRTAEINRIKIILCCNRFTLNILKHIWSRWGCHINMVHNNYEKYPSNFIHLTKIISWTF